MSPGRFTEKIWRSPTSVKTNSLLFFEWIKAVDIFADRII